MRRTMTLLPLLGLLACSAPVEAQTMLPEWAGRDEHAWDRSRVPQLAHRGALFRESASGIEGAADQDALLVCRVHVTGSWDLFADPDLWVRFRGAGVDGQVWGTENSRTEVFGFPGVRLRRGQRLSFRIVDRDITFDEHIATVRVRVDERMRAQAGHGEVECRAVDPRLVTRGFEAASAAAEEAITQVERARPALHEADLRRPTQALGQARAHLIEAAAWRGWRRSATARRRLEQADARFDAELRQAIARADAPRVGERVELPRGSVTVAEVSCAPRAVERLWGSASDAVACVIALDATSATGAPDAALGEVDVLDARGELHFVHDRRVTPTAEGARVVLALGSRFSARGALLRVADHRFLARLG